MYELLRQRVSLVSCLPAATPASQSKRSLDPISRLVCVLLERLSAGTPSQSSHQSCPRLPAQRQHLTLPSIHPSHHRPRRIATPATPPPPDLRLCVPSRAYPEQRCHACSHKGWRSARDDRASECLLLFIAIHSAPSALHPGNPHHLLFPSINTRDSSIDPQMARLLRDFCI